MSDRKKREGIAGSGKTQRYKITPRPGSHLSPEASVKHDFRRALENIGIVEHVQRQPIVEGYSKVQGFYHLNMPYLAKIAWLRTRGITLDHPEDFDQADVRDIIDQLKSDYAKTDPDADLDLYEIRVKEELFTYMVKFNRI